MKPTLLVATCLIWLSLLWPAPAEGIELATSAYDGGQGVGDLHGEETRLFNTVLRGSTYHRGQNRRYHAPRYTSSYTAPRIYLPKIYAPRYTAPRYHAPRYQAPRYQAPRYQIPRYHRQSHGYGW